MNLYTVCIITINDSVFYWLVRPCKTRVRDRELHLSSSLKCIIRIKHTVTPVLQIEFNINQQHSANMYLPWCYTLYVQLNVFTNHEVEVSHFPWGLRQCLTSQDPFFVQTYHIKRERALYVLQPITEDNRILIYHHKFRGCGFIEDPGAALSASWPALRSSLTPDWHLSLHAELRETGCCLKDFDLLPQKLSTINMSI